MLGFWQSGMSAVKCCHNEHDRAAEVSCCATRAGAQSLNAERCVTELNMLSEGSRGAWQGVQQCQQREFEN